MIKAKTQLQATDWGCHHFFLNAPSGSTDSSNTDACANQVSNKNNNVWKENVLGYYDSIENGLRTSTESGGKQDSV